MDRYQKLLCEKAKKKRELLGRAFLPRRPLLGIELLENKNIKDYKDLLKGLNAIGISTFILTSVTTQNLLPQGDHLYYLLPEKKLTVYGASDLVVVLDDEVSEIWKRGAVPIAKTNGAATLDYNPLQEKGNGFYFKNSTKWEVFAAIVRALETYQFSYDWENLLREILRARE